MKGGRVCSNDEAKVPTAWGNQDRMPRHGSAPEACWDDLYRALGARFCHDLASPLGGLGLMLEAMESPTEEDLNLLWQSQQSLASLLEFYRIFFARETAPHLLARSVELLKTLCAKKGVCGDWPETVEESSAFLGKGLALVVYVFFGSVRKGDAVRFRCGTVSWTLTFWTASRLPDIESTLQSSSSVAERESLAPHLTLLRALLRDIGGTIRWSRENSEDELAPSLREPGANKFDSQKPRLRETGVPEASSNVHVLTCTLDV